MNQQNYKNDPSLRAIRRTTTLRGLAMGVSLGGILFLCGLPLIWTFVIALATTLATAGVVAYCKLVEHGFWQPSSEGKQD